MGEIPESERQKLAKLMNATHCNRCRNPLSAIGPTDGVPRIDDDGGVICGNCVTREEHPWMKTSTDDLLSDLEKEMG